MFQFVKLALALFARNPVTGASEFVDKTTDARNALKVEDQHTDLATATNQATILQKLNITLSELRDALRGGGGKTLTDVWNSLQTQREIATSLFTDDSGAKYVRRDVVDESTGSITVSFTDASGAPAVPGTGLRPLASTDKELSEKLFEATAAGTGYAAGDILARVLVVDTSVSPIVAEASWLNVSAGTLIGSPTPGSYKQDLGLTDAELRAEPLNVIGTVGVDNMIPAVETGLAKAAQLPSTPGQKVSAASLAAVLSTEQEQILAGTRAELQRLQAYAEIAGLTFRVTLAAQGQVGDQHLTGWVYTRGLPWLRVQAALPASALIEGELITSTAADPNAPTADDIEEIIPTTLAGSALGGFDVTSFQLSGGAQWSRLRARNLTASVHEVRVIADASSLAPSGAHLPLSAPLRKRYKAPISRALLAAFGRGSEGSFNLEADADGNLFVRAVPDAASQAPGRTHFEAVLTHATAGAVMAPAPGAGLQYVVTSYQITAFNSSTTANGQLHLREDSVSGAIKIPHTLTAAIVGVPAPLIGFGSSFPDPLKFGDNKAIFVHFAGGTVTASVAIQGYIQPV
jgi:hypothetical protein